MDSVRNSIFYRFLFGGGMFFDLCKWIILFLVIIIVITKFWVTVFFVDGLSMEPTIHDGELVILDRYNGAEKPNRSDVVAVKYPGDPDHKKYVKRVIALPGETIEVKQGKVYIENVLLKEDYLPVDLETYPDGVWRLNDKEYFLMGDNRPGSNDSRYFGPVEKRFFLGKATYILYPRLRDTDKL